MATINNILQLSETLPRLAQAQHGAVKTTNDEEAPTPGRCSSSDPPQWTETNIAHSVASASTETGEQPATSHGHKQELELLVLSSSQHSADAGKVVLEQRQQEHQQEHQRPVLPGQQLRAAGSGDGPTSSSGPPGLVGEFSRDSASSVSAHSTLASPEADLRLGQPPREGTPAGNAGWLQPANPAVPGCLGNPVVTEGYTGKLALASAL